MKLSISHIAPYLPYGLKGIAYVSKDIALDYVDIIGCNRSELYCEYTSERYKNMSGARKWFDLYEVKALLLPMSSLYTEMEDGTVHICELANIATSELKYCNDLHWVVGGKKDKYATARKEEYDFAFDYDGVGAFWISQRDVYDGSCPEIEIYSQLSLFTYLFSHHFDVWNLIPQNLAIDKTKIK